METDSFSFLTLFRDVTVTFAAIIGGLWALFRFIGERAFEAALVIDVDSSMIPLEGIFLVAIDVILTNKGRVQIRAKTERTEKGFAYEDPGEELRNACSLQFKQIDVPKGSSPTVLDWFEGPHLLPVQQVPEINLLSEYEDPENNNQIDFWMEPQESYHLGRACLLSAGEYLIKVTFVGAGGDENFWSRVVLLHVGTTRSASDLQRS